MRALGGWCVALGVTLLLGCAAPACGGSNETPAAAPAEAMSEAALREKLEAAWRAKGPDYNPRTRHKNADGSPRYTNRLILETSPYLLQHAHNPVDWRPWGNEAFDEAKRSKRPVFLSIGYSTCHWCHVMEEESFEDEEIARYINEHFVPIKVDREERADVDAVYMSAVLSFTGSGGWPTSVWLTPDREPFFAGTYFPPRDGDRGARHGFLTVLREMATSYEKDPAAVSREAKQFAERVRQLAAIEPAGAMPPPSVITAAVAQAAQRFDPENGGLLGAPKFPSSFPVRLLFRHARRSGAKTSLEMAQFTLDRVSRGGIHDALAGGFHRYATDTQWRVPHFEKMLYDNALLATAYLEAGQATGQPRHFAIAHETLEYLLREMRTPSLVFSAATDADSITPSNKRVEGYFFTWTQAEIEAVLDGDAEVAALRFYDVNTTAKADHRSVLAIPEDASDVAKKLGWELLRFEKAVVNARSSLFQARSRRPPPLRDDKAITAWNAFAISALSRAAILFRDIRYATAAEAAAAPFLREVRSDRPLPHAIVSGAAKGRGFLDDHTAFALSLLDLFELTGDPSYLRDAKRLLEQVEKGFLDKDNGGYFLADERAETLLYREKPSDDGPIPSGSSLAAIGWLRLALLTSDDVYRERAVKTIRAFAKPLAGRPASLEAMLWALDFATDTPKEIVIVLPPGDAGMAALRPTARPLLDVLQKVFVPNAALVIASEAELSGPLGEAVVWAKGKVMKGGRATAYVCEKGACKLPVTEPSELAALLTESRPY